MSLQVVEGEVYTQCAPLYCHCSPTSHSECHLQSKENVENPAIVLNEDGQVYSGFSKNIWKELVVLIHHIHIMASYS